MKEGQLDILEFAPISRPSLFFQRFLAVSAAFQTARKWLRKTRALLSGTIMAVRICGVEPRRRHGEQTSITVPR